MQVSQSNLEVEDLRRRLVEARASLEVQTIRAEYASKEAERLKLEAERATENLRIALTRIPAALPPGKPSLISRLFGKSNTEENPAK